MNSQLRDLPSIDRLLRSSELSNAVGNYGHETVRQAARAILSEYRSQIQSGLLLKGSDLKSKAFFSELCLEIEDEVAAQSRPLLRPVFNLTGTVIHTNLGRAVLPEQAVNAIVEVSGSAVNLEYDLKAGKRGDREEGVEAQICSLTGAEAATVVNNNAAAVVLVLTALSVGRNVLISRGELVEIGGAFRIPEVMGSAGCHLKEVGATNRTRLADFTQAVDDETGLIMKVHTSNYEIVGFTEIVPESDLARLASSKNLPFVVDLGSGTLVDLSKYGLPKEPTVGEVLANGADLVTFSGDKLLGGPQAGIIAGKRNFIDKLKRHPLKRALRVDKLTCAALGAVLQLYRNPSRLAEELPILCDLTRSQSEIRGMAERVLPAVSQFLAGKAEVSISACKSQIGSGAMPVDLLDSLAIRIVPITTDQSDLRLMEIATDFRSLPVPVIGRIHDGSLYFDLRCLRDTEKFCRQLGAEP